MDDDIVLNSTVIRRPAKRARPKPSGKRAKSPRAGKAPAGAQDKRVRETPGRAGVAAAPAPALAPPAASAPAAANDATPADAAAAGQSRKNPVRAAPVRVPMIARQRGRDVPEGRAASTGRSRARDAAASAGAVVGKHLWDHADDFFSLGVCKPCALRLTSSPDQVTGNPPERRGLGLSAPTRVQSLGIPALLTGRDCLVRAETGSGKSLTVLTPILHSILDEEGPTGRGTGIRAIILAPTRELVAQLERVAQRLCQPFVSVAVTAISGGEKRKSEKARLRKGTSILVATPGRLLDHLEHTATLTSRGALRTLRWLVIDEADVFLDMGFEQQLRDILERVRASAGAAADAPSPWQTALLSATLPAKLRTLAGLALREPLFVDARAGTVVDTASRKVLTRLGEPSASAAGGGVGGKAGPTARAAADDDADADDDDAEAPAALETPAQLVRLFLEVPTKWRLVYLLATLRHLLQPKTTARILVFFSSCAAVEYLHALLSEFWRTLAPHAGTLLFGLHGSMSQTQRRLAVAEFSTASHAVLLCTDVAARGLDLPDVSAVVQADIPLSTEDFVHRAGRTARSGRGGAVMLFAAPHELEYLSVLSRHGVALDEQAPAPVLGALRAVRPPGIGARDVAEAGETAGAGGGAGAAAAAAAGGGGGGGGGGTRAGPAGTDLLQSLLGGPRKQKRGHTLARDAWRELEIAGILWQKHCEALVAADPELHEKAALAFHAHVSAYSTHTKAVKHFLHPRQLHLGHLAKAFALAEPPSKVAATARQPSARDAKYAKGKNGQSGGKNKAKGKAKRKIHRFSEFDAM